MIDSEGVILHHSFCFFHKFLIRHSTYFPLDAAILTKYLCMLVLSSSSG